MKTIDTAINSYKLKTHFTYNWYKYLMLLIGCCFLVTILFSTLRYDSPQDKRIDFLLVDSGAIQSNVEEAFRKLFDEKFEGVFETVTAETQMTDSTGTAEQVIMVRLAVGSEEDITIMPYSYFSNYAQQGCFLPLEDRISPQFDTAKWTAGYMTDTDSGERHLYGIPLSYFPGFAEEPFLMLTNDLFISVYFNSGNEENVVNAMNALLDLCR